jgi:hypothetical protein
MRLTIIANNCPWASWPEKIKALQDWFAPKLTFDVEIKHTNFQNIPFVKYGSEDASQATLQNIFGIQPDWYDKNIPQLAIGSDVVMFVIPRSQWEGGLARGWRTDSDTGPIELHLGCDENEKLIWPNMPRMDAFFQLARHEMMHAMFILTKQYDTTHFYWALGKLEISRDQLEFPQDWAMPGVRRMVNYLSKILAELTAKYAIPPAVAKTPDKVTNREILFQKAKSFIGQDASPYDKAPDNLGCAETVNEIYEAAFGKEIGGGTSTYWLYDALKNSQDFERVTLPLPGDIVISPTGYGGRNGIDRGHAGIVAEEGKIMSNESTNGKFELNYTIESWRARYEKLGNYPVVFFRRK